MDSLNTYKDHVLFKQNQQILETKLQNFTDVESIPESDSTILASYCVHNLLYNHSKILTAILDLLPEATADREFNETNENISPTEAIRQLIIQQNQCNVIFRNFESNRLSQLMKSANMATNITLIHDLPTVLGDQDEVKENVLKSLADFTAEGTADFIEDNLDIFLERFILTLKTSNLSAQAGQNLLLRKLTGTALTLMKEYMMIQQPKDDTEALKIMINFLESRFLISANSTLATAKLRQIVKGHYSFAQLQAKISKLAFYSTLDLPPHKRNTLAQDRGLEQFKIAINEHDRNLLQEEDNQRLKMDLPPLSLIGASMFLESFYTKQDVYSTVKKSEFNVEEIHNIVEHKPPLAVNNIEVNKNRPVTSESLGLPKNSCFLCGKNNHSFKKCFLYPNEKPFATLCKKCNKGAHSFRVCKQYKSENKIHDQTPKKSKNF